MNIKCGGDISLLSPVITWRLSSHMEKAGDPVVALLPQLWLTAHKAVTRLWALWWGGSRSGGEGETRARGWLFLWCGNTTASFRGSSAYHSISHVFKLRVSRSYTCHIEELLKGFEDLLSYLFLGFSSCYWGGLSLLFSTQEMKTTCRGPAPVDPGNSKRGRRRRGSGNNCLIKL